MTEKVTYMIIKYKRLATSILALFLTGLTTGQSIAVNNGVQALGHKYTTTDFRDGINDFDETTGLKVFTAVRRGDIDTLTTMLNNGVDLNKNIENEGTPLVLAIKQGNIALVEQLLELGLDVNQAAVSDGNPLIGAVVKGDKQLTKLLLSKGAEIDAVVPGEETALIQASRVGDLEMVRLLVANGADVNLGVDAPTVDGTVFRSPVKAAANEQIRNYLVSKGAR